MAGTRLNGNPRTAILGWGSLLWEGGADFDRWHGAWESDGPSLRIEFSRVSESRLGALTLVIDREHGHPTTVAWTLSLRKDPDDAAADVRCREGCAVRHVRRLDLSAAAGRVAQTEEEQAIGAWARERELGVVIWTALPSNFQKALGQAFSIAGAAAYLQGLPAPAKVKAAEYMWRAPAFVRTPLREAMEKQPWFGGPAQPTAGQVDPQHVVLHRYFIWANLMRKHFERELREGAVPETPEDAFIYLMEPGATYMSLWYAALYVVVEGWSDLRLRDPAIDELLVSPNTDLLKRYRNGVSHFQRNWLDARLEEFMASVGAARWVHQLHAAFEAYFLKMYGASRDAAADAGSPGHSAAISGGRFEPE